MYEVPRFKPKYLERDDTPPAPRRQTSLQDKHLDTNQRPVPSKHTGIARVFAVKRLPPHVLRLNRLAKTQLFLFLRHASHPQRFIAAADGTRHPAGLHLENSPNLEPAVQGAVSAPSYRCVAQLPGLPTATSSASLSAQRATSVIQPVETSYFCSTLPSV